MLENFIKLAIIMMILPIIILLFLQYLSWVWNTINWCVQYLSDKKYGRLRKRRDHLLEQKNAYG